MRKISCDRPPGLPDFISTIGGDSRGGGQRVFGAGEGNRRSSYHQASGRGGEGSNRGHDHTRGGSNHGGGGSDPR